MEPIYYHLSHYVSHKRAGSLNRQALLAAAVPLTDMPEAAGTVILHDDPLVYADLLARTPHFQACKKIAYAVWESADLPPAYAEALRPMDAVWTCSAFAQQALRQGLARAGLHIPVALVPHVVAPQAPLPADVQALRRWLPKDPQAFYFYTIADSHNPRKNLMTLLDIFAKTFAGQAHVWLLVKQYRKALDLSGLPQVRCLNEEMSESQLAALHQVAHCYVSAHHSEAWGLCLADALAAGKPCIATGYSGNMEFMNENNSFPVKYSLEPVSALMCQLLPLFTPQMHWAAVDPAHMAYLMRKVLHLKASEQAKLSHQARQSLTQYSPTAIGAIMRGLLEGG